MASTVINYIISIYILAYYVVNIKSSQLCNKCVCNSCHKLSPEALSFDESAFSDCTTYVISTSPFPLLFVFSSLTTALASEALIIRRRAGLSKASLTFVS